MKQVTYLPISGFPGYRVGDDGTVWSCRVRKRLRGKPGGTYTILSDTWKQLNPSQNKGRLMVGLYPGNKVRLVHRLVLTAFRGQCPEGMQTCHFPDRNPANNKLENLRWGTPKDNYQDAVYHGTKGKGSGCGGKPLLKIETVHEIRSAYSSGNITMKKLASIHKTSLTSIWNAIHHKSRY